MSVDTKRFCRQIVLEQVGLAGQQRLAQARVAVIGLGGLGSTASLLLAGSGIGHLILIDGDRVELSNLPRQLSHTTAAIGDFKAESAAACIRARHPDVQLTIVNEYFTVDHVQPLLAAADCVLDCTDNFRTRYLINRCCLQLQLPLVSAAAIRLEGQLTTFDFRPASSQAGQRLSPCYACLYPEPQQDESSVEFADQQNCWQQGILSPVPSIMASLQALEAVKVLLNEPDLTQGLLCGRLLLFEGSGTCFKEVRYSRDPQCRVCASRA